MPKKLVDIENLKEFRKRIDEKYVIEGEYSPNTSVGYADLAGNLDSKVVKNDKDAYLFRTAGGSLEIGDYCKVNHITGGSLGFNQLFNYTSIASDTKNGITLTNNNNGSFTLSGIATADTTFTSAVIMNIPNRVCYWGRGGGVIAGVSIRDTFTYKNSGNGKIDTFNGNVQIEIVVTNGTDLSTPKTIYPQFHDLTLMLGTTIADYIYNLETQTAGAGIAWFKKYFPKDYYPYTPVGSFVNVATKGKKYVGFNQFDGTLSYEGGYLKSNGTIQTNESSFDISNYIEVMPNTTYYTNRKVGSVVYWCFYDKDKNFISSISAQDISDANNLFTTPTNCYFLKATVRKSLVSSWCINFHYDGERDGEYEPYDSHTVDLDTNWNSIGIPQIDENGNLYFDGNRYNYDGSVDEEYDIIDLSTLTFVLNNNNGLYESEDLVSLIKIPTITSVKANMTCSKYSVVARDNATSTNESISINSGGKICVKSSSSTITGYLVYKKATTTQSTATPFAQVQKVDNWGTEEYLAPDDDTRVCEVPVGHDTDYPMDCKSKIEIAPDLPENDGVYVCKVESGTAEYVDLPTWLGTNNYVKQEDLSSSLSIYGSLNISSTIKKVYKIGNMVFITAIFKNDTGATISAGTDCLQLSGTIIPSVALNINIVGGYSLAINTNGRCWFNQDWANDKIRVITCSYAVA